MMQRRIDSEMNKEIQLPLSCPICKGRMILVGYHESLQVLKTRCWHTCRHCGFQRSVDEFKKALLTV
ncbi:MAG: hypothetical protein NPMRTHETA2_590002 [Nitrosopumilales archaeon]|nr:MAG: hypothetical protein NPMRTHETA2_590002 [Nitrosopumilales archaeon]